MNFNKIVKEIRCIISCEENSEKSRAKDFLLKMVNCLEKNDVFNAGRYFQLAEESYNTCLNGPNVFVDVRAILMNNKILTRN